ncbi:lipocalin-like domain-containing protein [Prosthecobacter debontii]|uniref:lipocalin-like domain-containing protein n=1 Tax=Prosthecobacter debontii TaxID=48467 RepID=UPI001591E4AF|nr:lipocalin-like domain-containing protein [Prosthecobacter debontii]
MSAFGSLFYRFILRPFLAEPVRTALTVLGIMLGVAVMLAIQLANSGSLRGFSAALDAVSGKASLEITAPPLGIDERWLPDLAWLREYGVATPLIEADVLSVTDHGRETLRLIGVDALRDPALRDYAIGHEGDDAVAATGMQLMSFLGEPETMLLSASFAKRHGLQAGDPIKLWIGDRERVCRIAGVFGEASAANSATPGAALAAQSLAILDIANAQVLLDKAGRVDRLELRLDEGVDVAEAEQGIRQRLPERFTLQRPQRRTAAVEKMLAAFHFNLTMLSGIALVVGVFLIYNTISVAVMTRRREVGMLRTLGVTQRQVMSLFLGKAALLGVCGALLGVPLAKGLAEAAVALTSTTVDTLYIAAAAQVPELNWLHFVLALGVAVPLSLLAAMLPVREVGRVSPVEAMRESEGHGVQTVSKTQALRAWLGALASGGAGYWASQQPAVSGLPLWGYFTCFCAIIGMSLLVPLLLRGTAQALRGVLGRVFGIEGRLAVAQIRASTHRLSISVAALAVSLALTVAIAVMVGSFRQTVLYWVDQTLGADLYVRPGTPARSQSPPTLSDETLQTLRDHPSVEVVETYRSTDMLYQDRMIKLGAGDFAIQLQHGRIAFKTRGDSKQLLKQAKEQQQVFVSESFALRFQVREGDVISLRTPKGETRFTIAALFYDYSNDSGTISMDREWFQYWFGESQPTHVAMYLKARADPETVKADLVQRLDGRGFVSIFTNAGLKSEVLRIFDSTFAITWALEIIAVLVAMAGIAVTMMTLVLERQAEIRLLRIAGAEVAQVRRTLMLESGFLGAVSQGLGLVVGLLLSLVLIHVINPQSFGWSIRFHMPWGFLMGATLLTIAGTVFAGLWPARRILAKGLGVVVLWMGFTHHSIQAQSPEWKPAVPGYQYQFPRDHGQHPEHKIEWWYFTGNLQGDQGNKLGYQLTFFRIGAVNVPQVKSPWALRDVWMAHFAISDLSGQKYRCGDRLNREGPGLAGANEKRVWNEDWQCTMTSEGAFHLQAKDRDFALDLTLQSGKPAVIHGQDGISQKGVTPGNASHYYSLTRMPTQGEVVLGTKRFSVSGESWMDHEFGTSFLEPGTVGWDWFSIQLDDGHELMLFQLRGGSADQSSAGTIIDPRGQVTSLNAEDFQLTPGAVWTSPGGARYPVEWQISIPKNGIQLHSRTRLQDQEFQSEATPGLGYWEGAVEYGGEVQGKPVQGRGYLEMTGYSGKSMSLWFGQK